MNTQNQNLILMNGIFNPKDALDILMNAYSNKIQFHEMKNFSSIVKEGKEDESALLRIDELKQCKEAILKIISDAEFNNCSIEIFTEVQIILHNHLTNPSS